MEFENQELSRAYYRVILPNLNIFCKNTEWELMYYFCERTLRFGKYSEMIKPSDFQNGMRPLCLPGVCYLSLRRIQYLRQCLKDRGLIDFEYRPILYYLPIEYRVNVPGMWSVIKDLYAGTDAVASFPYSQSSSILDSTYKVFDRAGWNYDEVIPLEDRYMKIKDRIHEGFNESEKALRRKKKRRGEKPMTQATLRINMMDICEEEGVKYHDGGFTKRDKGSARNFIKYCTEVDKDPRAVLREVITFWRWFHAGHIKKDDGKSLVLPSIISFRKFFNHREEILSWIEANRKGIQSKIEKYGGSDDDHKVIDLRNWKEGDDMEGMIK